MATNNTLNIRPTTAPLPVLRGGTGAATLTAHGVIQGAGSGFLTSTAMGAGTLLVGTTNTPAAVALTASGTAGNTVSVTSASGSITINNALYWLDVTATTHTMLAYGAYTASNAGVVTFTLPTSVYGITIEVTTGTTSGGWKIAQLSGQSIRHGNVITTTGTGGSLSSTAQGNSVKLVCLQSGAGWQVISSMGNLTKV
jgi:hypothetical protein